MKSLAFLFVYSFLLFAFYTANSQSSEANHDESKVKPYVLPELLVSENGLRIVTAKQWSDIQRPAILAKFSQHVYGKFPGRPQQMRFEVRSVDTNALDGKATRKLITVFFTSAADAPSMDILLYMPNHIKEPAPVFVGLNFYGNHSIHPDQNIPLSNRWMNNNPSYNTINNRATEGSRGAQSSRWPVELLIARGYGLATAYYGDLEPDHKDGWKDGVRASMHQELNLQPEEWGAISAWAWGLSRMIDYLETDKLVNAKKIALTGHSRLGKAALWAAANDTRFSIIISNNSGEGGASLARRNYGETVRIINNVFPWWFSPEYKKYSDHIDALPVDQHMLLALMAPRALYVASAEEDQWADPKGEFLSALHAEPAYQLFSKKGLGVREMPSINYPVGETIRYHIRSGKHDITGYDWQQYLNFADEHFKK